MTKRTKDLSRAPPVSSDAALFWMLRYDAARSDRAPDKIFIRGERLSATPSSKLSNRVFFSFLIFFFWSLMSLFSQHRSSSGTRSSDSSQIVDGTAMFSACQSAPRNLTPRPCIHRPLFLEAYDELVYKTQFQLDTYVAFD